MKKIFLKLLSAALLLSVALTLFSCGKDNGAPAGMITASSEGADYYFFVPDDWTVDLSTKASGAYYGESDSSSVSVISWDLDNTVSTLDDWWNINLSDIELVFKDVTVVSEENTTVSELYAKKYTYTASLGEFDYKIIQVACIKNSTVYVFTYTSTLEYFDAHLDEVDMMLENLTVK